MSGRRPVVKGCFEAVVNVSSAVIRRRCGETRARHRSTPARKSRGTPGRTENCLQLSSEPVDRIELNVSSLWRRQGPLSTMTGRIRKPSASFSRYLSGPRLPESAASAEVRRPVEKAKVAAAIRAVPWVCAWASRAARSPRSASIEAVTVPVPLL